MQKIETTITSQKSEILMEMEQVGSNFLMVAIWMYLRLMNWQAELSVKLKLPTHLSTWAIITGELAELWECLLLAAHCWWVLRVNAMISTENQRGTAAFRADGQYLTSPLTAVSLHHTILHSVSHSIPHWRTSTPTRISRIWICKRLWTFWPGAVGISEKRRRRLEVYD